MEGRGISKQWLDNSYYLQATVRQADVYTVSSIHRTSKTEISSTSKFIKLKFNLILTFCHIKTDRRFAFAVNFAITSTRLSHVLLGTEPRAATYNVCPEKCFKSC